MKIYKVKLTESGAAIAWDTYFGIAQSIEIAMIDALRAGKGLSDNEINLEVLSAELIAECSFGPVSLDLAA